MTSHVYMCQESRTKVLRTTPASQFGWYSGVESSVKSMFTEAR